MHIIAKENLNVKHYFSPFLGNEMRLSFCFLPWYNKTGETSKQYRAKGDFPMLPEAFTCRMRRLLGPEADAFFADRPRAAGVRFQPRKTHDRTELGFVREPIPWARHGFYCDPDARPGLHPYHDAGLYYLQEPSAMAPAALLDAQPGERILDLCAAPGGKSTQIAAAMDGRGLLVCNEIHPGRARILSGNIERLGVSNALVLRETPARLAERFAGWFDRVLVDAPCSGEGMFRKEAAALSDWSEDTVAMCSARQGQILCEAAGLVRPGGRLVYSTCTFAPEENEGVIGTFLKTHPDYQIETADAPWFAPGRPDWADGNPDLAYTFRLWPHRLRGEGHFAAVLRRSGRRESEIALQRPEALPPEAAAFVHEYSLPEGIAVRFGDTVFLAPPELPELRGLRVLRAGLELGQVRKGRFSPAHALALWLKTAASCVSFSAGSEEIARYLRGETLPAGGRGWTLVQVDGYSLGWGKSTDGILKNHYPRGLRRK